MPAIGDLPELPGLPDLQDGFTRRSFMKILGASIALAGMGGCTFFSEEEILPYVDQPEEIIPGKPLYYASSFVHAGFAYGTVVETHTARPTKVEGNPHHPASLGSTDPLMQAYLLDLYDPGRGQAVAYRGLPSTWDEFGMWVVARLSEWQGRRGDGLRVLTGTVTSPTLGENLQALLRKYPGARWHQYEPVNRDEILSGTEIAFGRPLNPCYRMNRAKVMVALDSDFFADEPGHVRYSRDFAQGRRLRRETKEMNRLYAAEAMPSMTGAMADHRLATETSRIPLLGLGLAQAVGVEIQPVLDFKMGLLSIAEKSWVSAAASDLLENRGTSLLLTGYRQPAAVHALSYLINEQLGNTGRTLYFTDPPEVDPTPQAKDMEALVGDMEQGRVHSLFIVSENPAYACPAANRFAEALKKVKYKTYLGPRQNETGVLCDWYLPESHLLESWGDARSFDGTLTSVQPMIRPLFPSKTAVELLGILRQEPQLTGLRALKDSWRRRWKKTNPGKSDQDFDRFWKISVCTGLATGSAYAALMPSIHPKAVEKALQALNPNPYDVSLEVNVKPDPRIGDGEFSNNAWLQELPKPLSQLTWENAVFIGPSQADKIGLKTGDWVELRARGTKIQAPVLVLPGHADRSVTVLLGYGRTHAGHVGDAHGFNAYPFTSFQDPWFAREAVLTKAKGHIDLPQRQLSMSMGESHAVKSGTFHQFLKDPRRIVAPEKASQPSLLPEFRYEKDAWAMVIDLNVCIGCKTCTIACQAENNIPVVGKDQVRKGREMHWIRVDRYFSGNPNDPEIYFQPVPCMQCEKAPCEIVCPTEATLHTPDGLNAMIYNRCVGTRFCSNNCPYKVRRFNFLHYSDVDDPLIQLMRNPNVTVRSRGVMEKCTYCIQRINAVKIRAANEGRQIRGGEVTPACAQACPTQAIVFGDKSRPESEVSELRKLPLNYKLLEELATEPRTTYLAKVTHRNGKASVEEGGPT